MNDIKNQWPFWFIVCSIAIALTWPILIQEGMFQDAVLYSSVARNLSIGYGTPWFLQYNTLNLEGIPSFHEQPPLVFWIQAALYRTFGDSMYVERIYTAVALVITGLLINVLWQRVNSGREVHKYLGWIPLFFWITIPTCFWSFRHNMIENTMGIFILISVIVSYSALKSGKSSDWKWVLSGIMIFLASFSKGVPGLFPIVVPFIYLIVYKDIPLKLVWRAFFIMLLVILFTYGMILLYPPARESLSIYFFDRLLRRVDAMPTVSYRLEIFINLLTELIPSVLIVTVLVLMNWKSGILRISKDQMNDARFFFLVGLSGTLPLMLTMVQKRWYMVPAFPFFAIAFGILAAPFVVPFVKKILKHMQLMVLIKITSIVSVISVFVFTGMQVGKVGREKEIISDVHSIGKIVPRFSTVMASDSLYDQYNFVFQGFLVRYYNISLDPYHEHPFLLMYKNDVDTIPQSYQKMAVVLKKYELYQAVEK